MLYSAWDSLDFGLYTYVTTWLIAHIAQFHLKLFNEYTVSEITDIYRFNDLIWFLTAFGQLLHFYD